VPTLRVLADMAVPLRHTDGRGRSPSENPTDDEKLLSFAYQREHAGRCVDRRARVAAEFVQDGSRDMRSSIFAILSAVVFFISPAGARPQNPAPLIVDENATIPRGARFFIAPIEGGYDIYLAGAMQAKQVPIVMVTDRAKADFEMTGVTETEKAGWAKVIFWKSGASSEQASIKVVNLKTGTVVYGYNVNKSSSARGKQSSAEACAKHLKEKIEKGGY
jgi:hypothetical protein